MLKEIWKKYNLGFYVSILGPLGMVIIHFVSLMGHFSLVVLSYAIFCFFILLGRIFIKIMSRKGNVKGVYLFGVLTILTLLAPLGMSLYKTMSDREAPIYIFSWLIYGYALYAFWKMGSAIYGLIKNRNDEKIVTSLISLISALFTIFMLEFALIKTFGGGANLYHLVLATQIVILVITIAIFIYLIIKYIKTHFVSK